MKKFIALLLCGILTATALTGCGSSSAGGENGEVIVYNWGEYIDPDTITMFEKETGIKVVYDEFETNEIMYPKVEAGSSAYDVVCPSDYGWHVIYVSFVYDEGEVYENGFNWNEREEEGTFSYLFYESLKSDSSSSSSYASMIQNQILGKYNTDTCVTLYENRYKDLLSLDK